MIQSRTAGTRAPNGASTIYLGKDGGGTAASRSACVTTVAVRRDVAERLNDYIWNTGRA